MDHKDYYGILGVPPNAEKKVIQQTFRKLARKVHSDVNPGQQRKGKGQRADEDSQPYGVGLQILARYACRIDLGGIRDCLVEDESPLTFVSMPLSKFTNCLGYRNSVMTFLHK
jgi:DnaJ domain